MNPDTRRSRSVTFEQLSVLLEDALSAAAGWTVVPPQIQLLPARGGTAAWTVECDGLDADLRSVVTRMQQRYRVRISSGGWQGFLARVVAGRRGAPVECQA